MGARSHGRARRAVLTAALAAGVGLAGCATPDTEPVVASTSAAPSVDIASPTSGQDDNPVADATFVIECVEGNILREPDTFTLSCADSNSALEGLAWHDWGADVATAKGDLVENDCEPSCAEGKPIRFSVTVEASKLKRLEATQVYTELTVIFSGKPPEWYQQRETFPLMS